MEWEQGGFIKKEQCKKNNPRLEQKKKKGRNMNKYIKASTEQGENYDDGDRRDS